MLGHVTIGVQDMDRAKQFYCDLLADVGASVLMDMGRIAMIGKSMQEPMLAVCTPHNEKEAHPGNGPLGRALLYSGKTRSYFTKKGIDYREVFGSNPLATGRRYSP